MPLFNKITASGLSARPATIATDVAPLPATGIALASGAVPLSGEPATIATDLAPLSARWIALAGGVVLYL